MMEADILTWMDRKAVLGMRAYLSSRPIKTKLLIYFLPILVLSVVLTGLASYLSAVKQLEKNAYYLLSDTIEQTGTFLNDKFYTLFSQLVIIEDNNAFRNIMSGKGQTVEENRYDDIIDLRKRFDEIYSNHNQMLDSIFVAFNNGRSFDLQKDFIPRRVGVDLGEWFDRYNWSDKGYYWLNSHQDTVIETVEPRPVMSVFKLIGTKQSSVNGLILLNLREQYFLDILRNVKISPNGSLALVSPDGVLYSRALAAPYEIGEPAVEALRRQTDGSGSLHVRSTGGEPMLMMYTTLQINRWTLAAIVPEKDILASASQIKTITLLIVLLILLVFAIAATYFASSLTNPIRFLSKQVKRVERGEFDVSFRLEEHNEIGVLAKGLGSLVESVKNLLQRVRDEQEQKRQMELAALQAQIHPHFLYNTLGSIKHLIDMGEKERAATMVSALTHFFRIGISKGREVITVGEEIEHVRNYLLIQSIRYSRDFQFEIELDEALLPLPIMKLTLQPIVENAIYHGIKNKRGRGFIRISGSRAGGLAILEVFDDGAGMNADKLERLQASIRSADVQEKPITFGLRNVHRRIALHFGERYGLHLESVEQQYTKVQVIIPFKETEETSNA